MSKLLRVKISKIISSAVFWIPVSIVYFQYRGVSQTDTFLLISLYAILVAVFEFPTGVISDFFSQSFSLKAGYLTLAIGFLLLSLKAPLYIYIIGQVISAIGMSMTSGSDVAVLSQYSENFQKDLKIVKIGGQITFVIANILGGFIFSLNPVLPMFLTGLFTLISALLIFDVKDNYQKESDISGNIFSKAKDGIKVVIKNPMLLDIVILSGFIVGFEVAFKFVLNNLFVDINLPTYLNGVFLGGVSLLVIIGVYFFKGRVSILNTLSLFILPLSLLLIYFFPNILGVIFALSIMNISRGLNDTYFDVEMNSQIPQSNKASVISLRSLILRGFSSLYTFIGGFVIAKTSNIFYIMITGIFFFILISLFIIKNREKAIIY